MIVRSTSGITDELDFAEAVKVFSAEKDVGDLTDELITSPFDLYSVETLRDHHGLRHGQEVPTDVLVFGKGEPSSPSATKVGGQPFWPEDEEWPTTDGGDPCFFLAQFNFADSVDILGQDLPELVLVLVTDSEEDWLWGDGELEGHWVPIDCVPDTTLRVPSVIGNAGPFFGVRHRTADYIDSATDAHAHGLAVLNGTKIGGIPCFIQSAADTDSRFLCQLGSIQAAPDVPYPWVNQKDPLSLRFRGNGIYAAGNSAVFGDMGSIYLFLDEDGEVTRSFECY